MCVWGSSGGVAWISQRACQTLPHKELDRSSCDHFVCVNSVMCKNWRQTATVLKNSVFCLLPQVARWLRILVLHVSFKCTTGIWYNFQVHCNGIPRVKGLKLKVVWSTVQASSITRYVKWSLKKRARRIYSHIDLYIVAKCYIGSSIFFLVL